MKGWTPQAIEKASKPLPVRSAGTSPVSSTKEPSPPPAPPQSQEITFNSLVPGNNGPNGLLRMGWRKRQRLAAEYEWVVAAARLVPMTGPVRLELVRYTIGGQLDFDNLVSTGKLPIDAIVRCGILPDDNPAVIAERDYRQERAEGKGYQRTVIRLIPL